MYMGISGKPRENKDMVTVKAHSHRAKVAEQAKISFDVCRFSFDHSCFRFVWIGSKGGHTLNSPI